VGREKVIKELISHLMPQVVQEKS